MDIPVFIVIASWLIFLIYWGIAAVGMKREVKTSREQMWFRLTLAIAALLILNTDTSQQFILAHPSLIHAAPASRYIGAALTAIGIAFAIWARRHLGVNWGMPMSIKEKPELITSGPYTYVRHPIYTGVLLAVFGSMLYSGALWLVIFIVACIYFVYSAKKEEEEMMKTFPSDYPVYKMRTKMLIPFIY